MKTTEPEKDDSEMSAVEDEAPRKRKKKGGSPKIPDKDEETIKKLKVSLSVKM
jgi:hypothetical protein